MDLFRLWIKELFSSLSFILSESVLTLSITIMTFCFVFSESMISGTDRIISLTGGEYNIFTSSDNSQNVKDILDGHSVEYKQSFGDIALIKSDKDTYVRFIKVVDKEYFTSELLKIAGFTAPLKNGIYFSNLASDSKQYALLFSSIKRAEMADFGGEFNTHFASFDKNIAFYVTDNISKFEKSLPVCFEISTVNNNSITAVSEILDRVQGVEVISKKDINERFYSSLAPTRRTIKFVAFLFIMLSAFYSISLMSSIKEYFAHDIKLLYINGYSKKQIDLICIFSFLIMMVFFIALGALLGVLLSYLFVPLVSFASNILGLNLSYYYLSFAVRIPFKILLIRYSALLVLCILLTLPVFKNRKKVI